MSKNRILLVEDDENLGLVVKDALELEGYDVVLAEDGKEGLQVFNQDTFDICVLDVMMPKKDGFSLAEDIRTLNTDVPILFLSAKSQTEDKIKGFKVGGDDYLTKPFNTEEFVLRIEALLRRSGKMKNEVETTFSIGKYQFDSQTYILTGPDFEKKLTKKEAQILKMLNEPYQVVFLLSNFFSIICLIYLLHIHYLQQ